MKVVIVKEIDEMPEDCDGCPFQDFDRNCGILGEYSMLNEWVTDAPYYSLKEKGDCPLKPLPQKIEGKREKFMPTYSLGWNDCLDAVELGLKPLWEKTE